jgi:hypothetical protein
LCIWSAEERPKGVRQSSDALKNYVLKKKIMSMRERVKDVKQFDLGDLLSKHLFDKRGFENDFFLY